MKLIDDIIHYEQLLSILELYIPFFFKNFIEKTLEVVYNDRNKQNMSENAPSVTSQESSNLKQKLLEYAQSRMRGLANERYGLVTLYGTVPEGGKEDTPKYLPEEKQNEFDRILSLERRYNTAQQEIESEQFDAIATLLKEEKEQYETQAHTFQSEADKISDPVYGDLEEKITLGKRILRQGNLQTNEDRAWIQDLISYHNNRINFNPPGLEDQIKEPESKGHLEMLDEQRADVDNDATKQSQLGKALLSRGTIDNVDEARLIADMIQKFQTDASNTRKGDLLTKKAITDQQLKNITVLQDAIPTPVKP